MKTVRYAPASNRHVGHGVEDGALQLGLCLAGQRAHVQAVELKPHSGRELPVLHRHLRIAKEDAASERLVSTRFREGHTHVREVVREVERVGERERQVELRALVPWHRARGATQVVAAQRIRLNPVVERDQWRRREFVHLLHQSQNENTTVVVILEPIPKKSSKSNT